MDQAMAKTVPKGDPVSNREKSQTPAAPVQTITAATLKQRTNQEQGVSA